MVFIEPCIWAAAGLDFCCIFCMTIEDSSAVTPDRMGSSQMRPGSLMFGVCARLKPRKLKFRGTRYSAISLDSLVIASGKLPAASASLFRVSMRGIWT